MTVKPMTVKGALKQKNKLIAKMTEELAKVTSYNSVEVGSKRPYSAKEALDNYLKMSDDLVELKTKIHLANTKVYDKIFMLSELKSQISKLKFLNCDEGKSASSRYSRIHGEESVIKTAEISILERDQLITGLEERIENLQDDLDHYNSITII